MSKHTPGPWHNGLDTNGNPIICQKYDGDLCGSKPNEEYQANCRLVSASPDLLSAMQYVLAVYEKGTCGHTVEIAFNQCRAAIAKATGEQNDKR